MHVNDAAGGGIGYLSFVGCLCELSTTVYAATDSLHRRVGLYKDSFGKGCGVCAAQACNLFAIDLNDSALARLNNIEIGEL